LHVEALALAKTAGELPVDEDRKPAVDTVRREAIGGAHHVDERLDERRFLGSERLVAGLRGRCCGRRCGRLRGGRRRGRDQRRRERRRARGSGDVLENVAPRGRMLAQTTGVVSIDHGVSPLEPACAAGMSFKKLNGSGREHNCPPRVRDGTSPLIADDLFGNGRSLYRSPPDVRRSVGDGKPVAPPGCGLPFLLACHAKKPALLRTQTLTSWNTR